MKVAPAPLGGDRLGGTANIAEHLRTGSGQDRQEGPVLAAELGRTKRVGEEKCHRHLDQ